MGEQCSMSIWQSRSNIQMGVQCAFVHTCHVDSDDKCWSIVDWQWLTIGDWWGFCWLQHTAAEAGRELTWLQNTLQTSDHCRSLMFPVSSVPDQQLKTTLLCPFRKIDIGLVSISGSAPGTRHSSLTDTRFPATYGFPVREAEIYSLPGVTLSRVQFLLQHDTDPLQCSGWK